MEVVVFTAHIYTAIETVDCFLRGLIRNADLVAMLVSPKTIVAFYSERTNVARHERTKTFADLHVAVS